MQEQNENETTEVGNSEEEEVYRDCREIDFRTTGVQYTINPVKAIRKKCLDCCCGNPNEVKYCTCVKCEVFPFRMGKNPYRTKREMTDEQKEAARERLAKIRVVKKSTK